MTSKFIPSTPVPFPVLMHSIVSFHWQMILHAQQREEAVFHWRQIRYYTQTSSDLLETPEVDLVEYYKTVIAEGRMTHIINAIKKFNLLEVD